MLEKNRSSLRNRVDRTNITPKTKKSSEKLIILVDFLIQSCEMRWNPVQELRFEADGQRERRRRLSLMARHTHGAAQVLERNNGHQPRLRESGRSDGATIRSATSQSTTCMRLSCHIIERRFHICHGFGLYAK